MKLRIIKYVAFWLLASLLTMIVASKEGLASWIVTYIWFGIGGVVGGAIGIIVLYAEQKFRTDFPEYMEKIGRLIKLILLVAFCSYLWTVLRGGGFSYSRNALGFLSWVFAAYLSRSCFLDICTKDALSDVMRDKKKQLLYPAIGILFMSQPMVIMMKITEKIILEN